MSAGMIYLKGLVALGVVACATGTTLADDKPIEEITVLAMRRSVDPGDISSAVSTA